MIQLEKTLSFRADKIHKMNHFFEQVLVDGKSDFTHVFERTWICEQSLQMVERWKEMRNLVLIGIGGSSLGAQVFHDWQKKPSARRIVFLDNLDPLQFSRKMAEIENDLEQTAFLCISKSGSSLETLATMDLLIQKFGKKRVLPNFGVVTEKTQNLLRTWAEKNGVFAIDFPLNIGGRFSVLTPSGLVAAAFLDFDLNKIMGGAKAALQQKELVSQFCASIVESWMQGKYITQFWLYSSHMKAFGAWLEQLWSESLGKAWTIDGKAAPHASTPMICIGSSHQHSLLQQLMEGQKDKLVVFLRNLEIESLGEPLTASEFGEPYWNHHTFGEILSSQAKGTSQALRDQGVPVIDLTMQDLSCHSIGACLMYWQLVVATLGAYMNIDPYNQPGVEAGKANSQKMLSKVSI